MRVTIIGQSPFASEVYKRVRKSGFDVVGVFTVPDKGQREEPLATEARNDGVKVFKIPRWREKGVPIPEIIKEYEKLQPDINLMPHCTQFIPMEVVNYPKKKSICYHPSLLPKHRGASAINWTLMNGDNEAGLSVFWPDDGLDTGPVFLQYSTPVEPNDTVYTLYDRFLFPKGIEAMSEALLLISKGEERRIAQDESFASYEPALRKIEQCMINFEKLTTQQLHNFVRGMDKVPGACIELEKKLARIYGSTIWKGPLPTGPPVEVKGMKEPGIVHAEGIILFGNDGGAINVKYLKFEDSGIMINAGSFGQSHAPKSGKEAFKYSDVEVAQRREIMAIWKGILGIEIQDRTDFFKSGAGSLDVTRLVEEINKKLNVKVEPEVIYTSPVFEDFAVAVFTRERSGAGTARLTYDGVTLRANDMEIKVPTQLFINNEFRNSSSGYVLDIRNPTDESHLCKVQSATAKDVDLAVESAHRAFVEGEWGKMNARERGKLMYRLADLMEERKEELATLESLDSGAVYTLALKTHVGMSIESMRYYAGWCDKIEGSTIPINNARPKKNLTFTKKEPIGVCGIITPWNYPLMMVAWKMSACLAAGNTVVLKPAQASPLTALKLAELSVLAGFPPGVINILPGRGGECGIAMAEHKYIRKLAFTGSTPVGKKIMASCAVSNLKKVSLELGGKSPCIIFADCDLDIATKEALSAAFFNKGENCIAAGRFFVEAKIHDEFVKRVIEAAGKLVIGDPLDRSTDHGPQNHKAHLDKLLQYIDQGIKEGANLVYGGKRVDRPGYFLQPTIFTDVTDSMYIAQEESFGPIMIISKFPDGDVQSVLRSANGTEYGLAAGVFTNDIKKALYVTDKLEAGTVFVNCYNKTDVAAPFGGFKQSGFGKDLGEEALKEYLKTKCVTIEF